MIRLFLLNLILCVYVYFVYVQGIDLECSKKNVEIFCKLFDEGKLKVVLEVINDVVKCNELDGSLCVYWVYVKNEFFDFVGVVYDLDIVFKLGDLFYFFYQILGIIENF